MPKNSSIGPQKYINIYLILKMTFTLAVIAAFGGEFLVETEAIAITLPGWMAYQWRL